MRDLSFFAGSELRFRVAAGSKGSSKLSNITNSLDRRRSDRIGKKGEIGSMFVVVRYHVHCSMMIQEKYKNTV